MAIGQPNNRATKQLNNKITSFPSSVFSLRCCRGQGGFTLIEMIVVVGLLATVGFISATIFFTTLKGGAKAEILKEVKQNGDYALTTMERIIRNSREISSDCDDIASSSIAIINPDYLTTEFTCSDQIASNSTTFLTSSELLVGGDCSFTCSPKAKGLKVISINFTLSQRGSSSRPEEKASVTFQTSVATRSYSD